MSAAELAAQAARAASEAAHAAHKAAEAHTECDRIFWTQLLDCQELMARQYAEAACRAADRELNPW